MIFAHPILLAALAALPGLWWLLRATPPAPRTEDFPAIRLLAGLHAQEETPARTPWWVLLLRLIACTLLIAGFAGPVLNAGPAMPGRGAVLLVIDNGWTAASQWNARIQAANAVLDRAERENRSAALLALADDDAGQKPRISPVMPASALRRLVGALKPHPWPADLENAAAALRQGLQAFSYGVYIESGIGTEDQAQLLSALAAAPRITDMRPESPEISFLREAESRTDALIAHVARLPQPGTEDVAVLAETGDGRAIARAVAHFTAGAGTAEARFALPPELRNGLTRLVLQNTPSAAGVALLDEASRRRPVGLLVSGENANAPLTGPLYYLRDALQPTHELREGDLDKLLSRDISVIILADDVLSGPDTAKLESWVRKGGLLIRFAGPHLAESTGTEPGREDGHQDRLLPVPLLAGDRQLGGALSWSKPAHLAPFPANSPFAGLPIPGDITITRQVLAEPSAESGRHSWAVLTDGTPLVSAASDGAGRLVLFHVTANADWSNLPLSGLFVQMLHRLTALAAGVSAAPAGDAMLSPAETLDGFGTLGTPPPGARPLAARDLATTIVSARHPPGFYGGARDRAALNLGANLPPLRVSPTVPGSFRQNFDGVSHEQPIGGGLIAAALLLLAVDLLATLRLRGLLGPALACVLLTASAGNGWAQEDGASPALATHLAAITSGDMQVDATATAGLTALSDFVNTRTAARLAAPVSVTPGRDDLTYYPLLYWPVTANTTLDPPAVSALNDYIRYGGILVIDTRDDNGAISNGAAAALQRFGPQLDVPPLMKVTDQHVLAHSFYLLRDFPGHYADDPVWVARGGDRGNDFVSPVVIGSADWASAWAAGDASNGFAVVTGGARQLVMADRFGVNLVMYALTGNYKADQVHTPAILERMGR